MTLDEKMENRRIYWRTTILLEDQLTALKLCAILQVVFDHGDKTLTRSDLSTCSAYSS